MATLQKKRKSTVIGNRDNKQTVTDSEIFDDDSSKSFINSESSTGANSANSG